ncbi:zinc metalloprotease, partial [Viscerimonas tarda]
RNGSVWKGVTSADSAKVYFTPNVVSANINGTAISTIYNDSLRSDTLQCKIVVVSVEFEEDPSQKWGFDENDTPKEDLYSSYKNTLPISGIKWKSVRSDGSYDKLRIKISPIGAEKSITLMLSDSTNYDVRPKLLNANQQTIEVKSNVNVGDAALFAKVSFFLNDTIQVKIKGYDLVTKKVAIITVNESNDDIQNVNYGDTTMLATTPVVSWGNNKFLDTTPSGDDYVMYRSIERDSVIVAGPNKICDTQANNTDIITTIVAIANIQAALTDRYKYAVVEFVVDPSIYTRTINYDFNKNGMIDIRVSNTAYLDEMKRIVDSCKIVVPNLYNLFIVDYPNNSNTNGIMLFNQSFGFFFPKKVGGSSPSNISATAAHEVGHGTFGLRHPWDKQELHIGYPYRYAPTSNWTPKDINNLMEWDGGWSRDKLRKYQWDKIVR